MTIKECYEKVGSDYDGVLKRLGSEALVKRFAVKFLNDPSFQELTDGLAAQDGEKAFRAAHTLKGNIINLRKKWKGICSQVPFIVLKYRQGCI